jgi:subtilisin-like proprotein convertase family protein
MKTKLTILGLLTTVTLATAQTFVTNSFPLSPNAAIPQADPSGVAEYFNVTGLGGLVTNVQVNLDITGGFNGTLYAYLAGPQGQLAVLLNRVGVTGSNPVGYGDAGFDITLDGQAVNNIHSYGSGYSVNGMGQVTGTWAADGRNIDPQSPGSAFDSALPSANLGLFDGTEGNGMWTLFIADMVPGGGTATLNSVELIIMTVPEPQTWAMLGGGLALVWLRLRRNQKV